MLKLENISFSYYKNKIVVKDISFTVKDNECAVLLGPNGVGKSTIINCILGVNKINNGNIYFDEKPQKEVSFKEKSKQIAYVPQLINGNDLSVKESIILGRLPYFKLYPSKNDLLEVDRIINEFGLSDIADKPTNEISGGERQKVAIARAVIQDSKNIIFDEPTSNLDIKSQVAIMNIIKKVTKQENKCSLISMHDINLALALGDKFIFLKDEKVYRICSKEEITEELLKEVYGVNIKLIDYKGEKIITYEKDS